MMNKVTVQYRFKDYTALLLAVFLDGIGLGILFPTLTAVIITKGTSILAIGTTTDERFFIFNLVLMIYMVAWFFGSSIVSTLSDSIGRRKALILCMIGKCLGFLISAYGIAQASLPLIILGRLVDGFTNGTQAVSESVMADVSSHLQRATYIGYILLPLGIGLMVGAPLNTWLSNAAAYSWFTTATPFYGAAAISLISIFIFIFLFRESLPEKMRTQFTTKHLLTLYNDAIKHKNVRLLLVIFFITVCAWGAFYGGITGYAIQRWHFTGRQAALLTVLAGAGYVIAWGFLVNFLSKRYSLLSIAVVTKICSAICILLFFAIPSPIAIWVMVILGTMFNATAYVCIYGLFSVQVNPERQGWVLGISNAVHFLAFGIGPLLIGLTIHVGPNVPTAIVVCLLLISASLLLMNKSRLVGSKK